MRSTGTTLLLLAASLALAASGAGAAETLKGRFAVSLLGGVTLPVGQLARSADVNADVGESGLDLGPGANVGATVDWFVTDRWSVGAYYGDGMLHMRDFTLHLPGGDETVKDLVKGRTTIVGATTKLYLTPKGAMAPYAFAAVANFHRVGNLSRDILKFAPGATVFEVSDDAVGVSGGVGGEYRFRPGLALNANAGYWYSGKMTHTFPYMGFQTVIHDWSFWVLDAGLTVRFPFE